MQLEVAEKQAEVGSKNVAQAVSKWELGEGYPEVDKLLILSKKLNVSLDSLLGGENTTAISEKGKPSAAIRRQWCFPFFSS